MGRSFEVGDRVRALDYDRITERFRNQEGTVTELVGDGEQYIFVHFDFEDSKSRPDKAYRIYSECCEYIGPTISDADIARLFGVTPTRPVNLELDRYEKLDIIAKASSMPMSVEGLVHIAIDAFLEGAWEDGIYKPREENED